MARFGRYLSRRIGAAALVVLIAVNVNFFVFRLAPGDPATTGLRLLTEAQQAAMRESFGLDRPLAAQYAAYLGQTLHGNLGISFHDRQPVAGKLGRAMANTAPLIGAGLALALVPGLLLGALAAARGRAVDGAVSAGGLIVYALPSQVVGLVLIFAFAGMLPSGGRADPFLAGAGPWERTVDALRHLILPATTLALGIIGSVILVFRATLRQVLAEDYILTARAKGLTDRQILCRHALRNAAVPTVAQLALLVALVFSGATVLVETIFSWPGIGQLVFDSVARRDYPTLQGAFLVFTLLIVASGLLADAIAGALDPRIRAGLA